MGFRTKVMYDGTVYWHESWLVAQGFTQIHGLVYWQTFRLIVKASKISVVPLVIIIKWRLHKLDIKNVFMHGQLHETTYIEQPLRFIDPKLRQPICSLNKVLYGKKHHELISNTESLSYMKWYRCLCLNVFHAICVSWSMWRYHSFLYLLIECC